MFNCKISSNVRAWKWNKTKENKTWNHKYYKVAYLQNIFTAKAHFNIVEKSIRTIDFKNSQQTDYLKTD